MSWWRDGVIYQIYPRSFADSDGDGIGDLRGITARLDHLTELGVDALWLSPFYPSPQADGGYDVADYRGVDPMFGTLGDFDALAAKARQLRLRLIIDLVPNHSSDQHPWFQAALAAPPDSVERERYIFRDGRGPHGNSPPNDWVSVFAGPAWTRVVNSDGTPGQWYLHLFDHRQPDFNWDNSEVRAEFLEILRFWLDRGVDGFRVDVAHGLVKRLDDFIWKGHSAGIAAADPAGKGPPMWDQDGVHEIYRSWRTLLDGYLPAEKILVAEAWVAPPARVARYVRPDEMHQAFNFEFLLTPWDAERLRAVIALSLEAMGAVGALPTWVLSNHDVVRAASRFGGVDTEVLAGIGAADPQPDPVLGLRRARAAALLMLGLPGAAYIYQGEELGLPEHTTLPDELRQDPIWERSGRTLLGRDGCRVPIPWEAGAPAYGFSSGGKSWLPQPETWSTLALDRQRGAAGSTYELFRSALALRRENALGKGPLTWLSLGDDILAARNGEVLVITNFSEAPVKMPEGYRLLLSSEPFSEDNILPDTTVWAHREDRSPA